MVSPCPTTIHRFPQHATRFVGRDSEISEIVGLLDDPDCRLLTLTGFGGIGKTRLAIEVATLLAKPAGDSHVARHQFFLDGTYFVGLAPLTSSDLLATTIADTLNIPLSGAASPRDQLLAELERKNTLLLLDNFEHIMEGKTLVSDILTHAPDVTILVTSRDRLMLPEETIYDLKGMSLPSTDEVPQVEDYSALLLFSQIAQKVDWRFSLNDEHLPHVIRICRLAEGIPLAIEMAAAWVRVLSCQEIADELARSHDLLKTTIGHFPARHRSIRAVFDYSWALLTEAERQVFQNLTVFRGGFRREAAEQIAGATLESLVSLIDKSLLQHDTRGRYQIHELLHQFASEKIAQNPDHVKNLHGRHCAYYAHLLNEHETEFTEYDVASPVVTLINADLDNIRAMWHWATEHQQFTAIGQASGSLYHYFRIRDAHREAAESFQTAVTSIEAAEPASGQDVLLARLLGMLALFTYFCGSREWAVEIAQRGLSLAHPLNLPMARARCMTVIGIAAFEKGAYEEARQYLEESMAIYAASTETYETQFVGLRLGWSYQALGDHDLALQHFLQLVDNARRGQFDRQLAWALMYAGSHENFMNLYTTGRQHCAESLEIFERLGLLLGISASSASLADSYSGLGQHDNARHYFHVALTAYVDHGSQAQRLALRTLAKIADLLALESDVARAVELASFVQQNPQVSDETRIRARQLAERFSGELAPAVLQAAQERGTTLELKSLVANLIEEFSPDHKAALSQTASATEYELELLQQVIDGLATGTLLDENQRKQEHDGVLKLMATVDEVLEREKAKVMATFVESASHDLRTPLAIINTSLYLLERISDPDTQQDHLQLVKDQVVHLQTLIENLIIMARLDSGTNFILQSRDLNQVVRTIQDTHILPLMTDRHLDIRFTFVDEPLLVPADRDNLQLALLKVIENAIQNTPDDGTISVKLYSEAGQAVVAVTDTGVGIEEVDLPYIFERFYRADKARTNRGRSGLGLAIAQKIVAAHDGSIDVVSIPGEGSTFRIMLPRTLSENQPQT